MLRWLTELLISKRRETINPANRNDVPEQLNAMRQRCGKFKSRMRRGC